MINPRKFAPHLGQQLSRPVQWWATVRRHREGHIGQMIECGPGKVLTALNRRIEKRAGPRIHAPGRSSHA